MGLVDANGMGPPSRFIELSIERFDELIPGTRPTDDQRTRFYAPMLKKTGSTSRSQNVSGQETPQVKGEFALYPQVTQTVQSVLNAAGETGTRLRYLETPRHKADDGTNKSTDTVNDGGIYLNTEAARAATTMSQGGRGKRLKKVLEQSEHRGRRSWNYMAVPFEIKYDPQKSAFHGTPTPKKKSEKSSKEAEKASNEPRASSSSHAAPDTPSTARGSNKRGHASRGHGSRGGRVSGKGKAPPSPSIAPPPMRTPDCSTPDGGSVKSGEPTTTTTTTTTTTPAAVPAAAQAARPKQDTFIRDSMQGEVALAQFGEYMFNVFKHQHRIWSWAVYITNDQTRLLYFDRAGAFVSQSFDWTNRDSLLHTFVWKLAHMSDADLGYDPSATRPEPEELERMHKVLDETDLHPAVRQFIEEEMGDGYPLYKLCVTSYSTRAEDAFPDENAPAVDLVPYSRRTSSSIQHPPAGDRATWKRRFFIVGRPHFAADSLIGRCTRGYIAFDLTDDDFYYLKDLWRSWVPGRIRPEHLVYERLQKHRIQGIAPLICGGDVGGPLAQRAGVQDSLPGPNRPVMRVHYRIVTGTIGLSLTSFENFAELSKVLAGALMSHHHAWTKAKVLHRDISPSNILIDPTTRRSILIDWDLSRLECELQKHAAEPDRTGTWQFRSGLSLYYPYKPYVVADDVESVIHLFHYLVLRFHRTSVAKLYNTVDSLYQQYETVNGIKIGGIQKIENFSYSHAPFKVVGNPELQNVLNRLAAECYDSYLRIDHERMLELFGVGQPVAKKATPLVQDNADDFWEQLFKDFEDQPSCSVTQATPVSHAIRDCFEVEGFLTKAINVASVLRQYNTCADDKAEDQFEARAQEDEGSAGAQKQHIGLLSRTCTSHFGLEYQSKLQSEEVSKDHIATSMLPDAPDPSAEVTPYAPQPSPDHTAVSNSSQSQESHAGSNLDTSLVGGTRTSQKRIREQEEDGQGFVDGDEEDGADVRPGKRQRTSETASGTHD